jgi:(R,R)-butanediol dehydrogenase/meso-butanediol dehydrogenase/diacetyl reductase
MKAAVFKEFGKPMEIENVADPSPEADQLVVKVGYCGICGTDLHSTREGPAAVACDSILGHEFVGEVVEIGSELREQWHMGDRVCSLPFLSCGHCVACVNGRPFECEQVKCTGLDIPGGFAEFVTTGAMETIRLPDELSMQSAALIEPLAVALHAARVGGLQAGHRVLITGAGPIGLAVALWCRFLGARDVVVSEFAEQRRALAAQLGATAVINPAGDLGEQFADAAGGPPDIIFECVGAPGLIQQCVEVAPRHSTIVPVGVCEQPDSFMPFLALVKELQFRFAIAYTRDDFETVIAMLAQGRISGDAMVTDVVSLEQMPSAFEALRTPSHQCKVLTKLWE